ncbi:uncharacterized protein LOC120328877 [Styela clava]
MKESRRISMETGDDYDQMLRSMFESCDTVGLGLLTPKDFEKLCKKLSIQEHATSLSGFLFPETNIRKLLSYETFRDTLIRFLTGDAGFVENVSVDEMICNEQRNDYINGEEDNWNNNTVEYSDENRLNSENSRYFDSDADNENHYSGQSLNNKSCNYNRNSSQSDSPNKYRRYGRTSQPDMDLLKTRKSNDSDRPIVLREVQVENTKHFDHLEESSPENSPWKAVEVSFITDGSPTPIIMKEEEYTGEGKDEDWTNPDSEIVCDLNSNVENPDSDITTVKEVQTELEIVWNRVVGDLVSDAMNENQLGCLCSELGMGHLSKSEDISALFAALDGDQDGFVKFHEFSEQMSVFLSCAQSNQIEPGHEHINTKFEISNSEDLSGLDYARDCVFSTSDVIEENMTPSDDVKHFNLNSSSAKSITVIHTPVKAVESRETSPMHSDVTLSPATSMISSDESRTPESRGHLSLDSDTSPLCPTVVAVEPRQLAAINRGRRRRRSSAVAASNPAGVRQQRRKSSRSIPLPHYHPASIRKLDQLPLSYLTEENERYVSLETLRENWEDEGLENPNSVLEALQFSATEQSVSIEALSEVLDMEVDQNIIQRAALILYKRGINHYRAKFEHERAERSKQESTIDHLMSQLQEQEERIESAESKFDYRNEELEAKYKSEIRGLTEELSIAQIKIKEYEQESMNRKNSEYNDLVEKYEKSESLLEELKSDNEKLLKQKEEVGNRLRDAEENMIKMQEDLNLACRGVATFHRQHAIQRKQYADLLRMYEAQAQSIEDTNDELLDRLQQSQRRWSSPHRRSKSPSTRSKTSFKSMSLPLLRHNSDTSSYSSASEDSNSHHLSTCQVFVNDIPSPITSSTHFMTSSPTTDIPPKGPKNILPSDAFAFLTPSTTHAKSRVQSYAPVTIVPPSLSENCSNF